MKIRGFIKTELNAAGLRFLNNARELGGGTTVPAFGFGIRPRGPRTRPSRPAFAIMSGVAIATSKSVKPS